MDFLDGMDKIDIPKEKRDEAWAMRKLKETLWEGEIIVKVSVDYSGGNDDGSINRVTVELASGRECDWSEPNVRGSWDREKKAIVFSRELTELEELYFAVVKPVEDQYGSFAGDFSVDGTIVWDVVNNQVLNRGEQEVREWVSYLDELWSAD